MPRTTAVEDPALHTRATRARQGAWGRHMIIVLIASTVLAALALLAAMWLTPTDLSGDGPGARVTNPADLPAGMAPTAPPAS